MVLHQRSRSPLRRDGAEVIEPCPNASVHSRGCQLLSAELRTLKFDCDVSQQIATGLVDLALAENGNDARQLNTAIRGLLRYLRQARSAGERIVGVGSGCENAGLAAAIWRAFLSLTQQSRTVRTRKEDVHQHSRTLHTATGSPQHIDAPVPADARKVCFTLGNVMTAAECSTLIARCDLEGWHPAALEYGLGSENAGESIVNVGLRDSDRCIVDDEALAARLWTSLQQLVTDDTFAPLRPVRINSHFRCLRYSVGQAGFAKHIDGRSVVNGAVSKLTVQLYLNEGFEGGATRLCLLDDSEDTSRGVDIVPRIGMAFVFDHSILHKGCPVSKGVKYTARTEVMYS